MELSRLSVSFRSEHVVGYSQGMPAKRAVPNSVVAPPLGDPRAQTDSAIASELRIAALVPIAFITVNLLAGTAEEIVIMASVLTGNYQELVLAHAEAFAMGTLFAQVVIVAIWAGLAPDRTYLRTCLSLIALVLVAILVSMFSSKFTPSVVKLRSFWMGGLEQFGWLLLVVLFSCVQLPLIGFRVLTGRYLGISTIPTATNKRQFSMLELVGLPVLVCFPILVLTVFFEAKIGLLVIGLKLVLAVVCLGYAALFLLGFMRESISNTIYVPLIVLGPVILLPVSIYLAGGPTGTFQGIPFFGLTWASHLGVLTVGVPSAIVARRFGYRLQMHRNPSTTSRVPTPS